MSDCTEYGNVTDEEFVQIKRRIGDMALENPDLVKQLVADLREQRENAASALSILDRVPDVPPDPGDEPLK